MHVRGDGDGDELLSYWARFNARAQCRIADFLPPTAGAQTLRRYLGPPLWRHNPAAYVHTVARPLWDLLGRQGKGWRPFFTILTLEALGTPVEPYEQLLTCVSELTHTGTLMVDDVEDGAPLRRGAAAIHLRYGVDVAINTGNLLYFLPSLLVTTHPRLSDAQKLAIHDLTNRHFVSAHFGQAADIYWSGLQTARDLPRQLRDGLGPRILESYAQKTGSPVAAAAEAAAVIAGADAHVRAACAQFARTFGACFQIMDDIRNLAEEAGVRKAPGEDVTAGKLTYVACRALERLGRTRRARLARILVTPDLRTSRAGCREALALIRGSGAAAVCAAEAAGLFRAAWKRLSPRLPPTAAKRLLHALCRTLIAP